MHAAARATPIHGTARQPASPACGRCTRATNGKKKAAATSSLNAPTQ